MFHPQNKKGNLPVIMAVCVLIPVFMIAGVIAYGSKKAEQMEQTKEK